MSRVWNHFQFLCAMLVIGSAIVAGFAIHSRAATPGIISYQGRVQSAAGVDFTGNGAFKFALVDGTGSTTYWSNDLSSANGSEPTGAVSIAVSKGLYSTQLGNTAAPFNMSTIPASVFSNSDVRLRIWFSDGTNGSQLLTPDQRVLATGYALQAAVVDDGSVTTLKIADGAVTSAKIADAPKARIFNSTTQSITGGVQTNLSFDTKDYDSDNMYSSGSNSQLKCNTTGTYLITSSIGFQQPNNSSIDVRLLVNNNVVGELAQTYQTPPVVHFVNTLHLTAGDIIAIAVNMQSSGNVVGATLAVSRLP